jgi:hypothetical protein
VGVGDGAASYHVEEDLEPLLFDLVDDPLAEGEAQASSDMATTSALQDRQAWGSDSPGTQLAAQ